MVRRLVALCVVASLTPLLLASADARGSTTKFHTSSSFLFHQLTTDLTRGDEYRGGIPVISGDGNWVVFGAQTGSTQPYVIDEMKFDGTDRVQLDTWPFSGQPFAQIDISDDGQRVISSDGYQLRTATQTSELKLIELGGQEISQIAISGDGSLILFIVRRDTSTTTGQPIQRGLWSIAPSGTGLRQLAGPDNVAAALNLKPSDIFPFDTDVGSTLDVSGDGSNAVFSTMGAGQGYLLGWKGGSVLRLAGPPPPGPGFPKLWHAAISGTGSTVAYDMGGSTRNITMLDNFGTQSPTLVYSGGALLTDVDRLQLSEHGGYLLAGSSGLLFDAPFHPSPTTLNGEPNSSSFTNSTYALTMEDGPPEGGQPHRFVYVFKDAKGAYQIASIAEGGPHEGAPTISSPSIVPTAYVQAGGLPVTLKVKVAHEGKLNYVRYTVLVGDGGYKVDPNMSNGLLHKSAIPLYYKAPISAYSTAAGGHRTVRVEAQATVDGKLLAAEVDVTPLTVKK